MRSNQDILLLRHADLRRSLRKGHGAKIAEQGPHTQQTLIVAKITLAQFSGKIDAFLMAGKTGGLKIINLKSIGIHATDTGLLQ
ncbi:hypothetical protein D3C76_1656430 [compost metagenome]